MRPDDASRAHGAAFDKYQFTPWDPSQDPGNYPRPRASVSDRLELVSDDAALALPLRLTPGARIADAGIADSDLRLGETLEDLGVAPIGRRHLLLTVGSLAEPGRAVLYLQRRGASTVLPILACRVRGVDAAWSAIAATYGVVGTTATASPGTELCTVVLALDRDQLEAIFAGEQENCAGTPYELVNLAAPVWLPGEAQPRWSGALACVAQRRLEIGGESFRPPIFAAFNPRLPDMSLAEVLRAAGEDAKGARLPDWAQANSVPNPIVGQPISDGDQLGPAPVEHELRLL